MSEERSTLAPRMMSMAQSIDAQYGHGSIENDPAKAIRYMNERFIKGEITLNQFIRFTEGLDDHQPRTERRIP